MSNKNFTTLNRTFARRIGKRLSDYKKDLLAKKLPECLYSPEKLLTTKYKKIFLEVGYGMGEHFVHQVQSNSDSLYVGAEVFLNGVARVLNNIQDHEHDNYLLWPDDLDAMLEQMPDNCLDGIYVLFPDPWHKKRYMKKRLFNKERLEFFKHKLKEGGFIAFASDIDDYFEDAHKLLEQDKFLHINNSDYSTPHSGYIQTKYHSKAINEGRAAQFIQAIYKK